MNNGLPSIDKYLIGSSLEYFNSCLLPGVLNPTSKDIAEKLETLKNDSVDKPYFFIGAGTCGLGAGAIHTEKALLNVLKNHKFDYEIIKVGCIGLCFAEPIMDVFLPGKNRLSFGNVTPDKVEPIVLALLQDDQTILSQALFQYPSLNLKAWQEVPFINDYPFFKKQKRIVLNQCGIINPLSIGQYIAQNGYSALAKTLKEMTPIEVCNIIENSGLKGRGGGGFSTGKKWKFALNTPSDQKYFICNADEGDPGAFMDRAVVEGDPHKLLEGLIIAAYAIQATKAYIYIRAEYPLAIAHLEKAINDLYKWKILGSNIFDSGFDLDIIIKKGAGAFVCGEETALIHSIEGKRGMPRPRPPFPAVSGLHGKPSVINNVETLANISSIILKGSDWFNSMGNNNSKGTKVFALSGKIKNTGLVEVPMGITMREIIFDIGGGPKNNKLFKAVQIGGPSGGCVTDENLNIEIDYDSLKTIGAMMGSGGLVVMDEDNCMVDVAKFFMDFIQRESCGKCIPCREGTKQMQNILEKITRGRISEKGNDALDRFKGILQLEELSNTIKETSLCGLGQSAPNPILSTLKYFRNEYEAHIFDRRCPSGVCIELVNFEILEEKCIGCTLCAKKCPSAAIKGSPKAPHYINNEKCIKCGQCLKVCKFGAIIKN